MQRIAACIGESSTDGPILENGVVDDIEAEEMDSEPSLSAFEERLFMAKGERECASLESEMCAVANKHRVARHFSLGSGVDLHNHRHPYHNKFGTIRSMEDKEVQYESLLLGLQHHVMTQTDGMSDAATIEQLNAMVTTLEQKLSDNQAAYDKEKNNLKAQCSELETGLQLLREEYDKCEDYWQDKLTEARDMYEEDKRDIDEKFQDLLVKIKEYEELLLSSSSNNDRLPPIEERASLERQVTDLEEECDALKHRLTNARMEQESVISTYQRSFEVNTPIVLKVLRTDHVVTVTVTGF